MTGETDTQRRKGCAGARRQADGFRHEQEEKKKEGESEHTAALKSCAVDALSVLCFSRASGGGEAPQKYKKRQRKEKKRRSRAEQESRLAVTEKRRAQARTQTHTHV